MASWDKAWQHYIYLIPRLEKSVSLHTDASVYIFLFDPVVKKKNFIIVGSTFSPWMQFTLIKVKKNQEIKGDPLHQ